MSHWIAEGCKAPYNSHMLELQAQTLIVFFSDSHIGGDHGCDAFESPEEVEALFEELRAREEPVELILAGDFFDFLQISDAPEGTNRASLTMSRPEYQPLFASLKRFKATEGKRVVYLPGNHDAEGWWNPEIQETLREEGLVDEFPYYYAASMPVGDERRIIYCEHGNQVDPANVVEDYHDRLDTPLGYHVVTDFTRRVAPFGEISGGLDLSELKMVYPLVAIPRWVASRYFYDFIEKALAYLLLPLLGINAVFRVISYLRARSRAESSRGVVSDLQGLPGGRAPLIAFAVFSLTNLALFATFFFVVRRAVRKALESMSPDEGPGYRPDDAERRIEEILRGDTGPPMAPSADPNTIDVFVSGHTHMPSLTEMERRDGQRAAIVNSGCFLRQLNPISPQRKGPPVFVSKFVLTHARVYARDGSLHVELWEHPKRARQKLSRIERLLSWGRRPPEPPSDASPRVQASVTL
jgi:UDP-2,3-diacylglucosamine pyrophosphatase LpxH